MATPSRPPVARKSSRVPGDFNLDEDLSPIESSFDKEDSALLQKPSKTDHDFASGTTELLVNGDDESGVRDESLIGGEQDSFLQERDMRRQLEDLDSTFLQTVSPAAPNLAASPTGEPSIAEELPTSSTSHSAHDSRNGANHSQASDQMLATNAQQAETPASDHGRKVADDVPATTIHDPHFNTSALETMSSSPTAAAAARTVSRVVSLASMDQGYETADDSKGGITLDRDPTPTKTVSASRIEPEPPSSKPSKMGRTEQVLEDDIDTAANSPETVSGKSSRRPQYLSHRQASQRSSRSSYTVGSIESGSDLTVGADFALQTGGAVPQGSLTSKRPVEFSRTVSLGSVASGISGLGDQEEKAFNPVDSHLHTLVEEDTPRGTRQTYIPQTPGSPSYRLSTPTDTVIAQHVRDVQVPPTLAREFQSRQRQTSPDKRSSMTTPAGSRNGKSLTLKEQSSTIDRLVKENFDLKLKITFLDEALNRRSDEGVKAMISENVDLRTTKFKSAKETRELKRSIRDLERKFKDKTEELLAKSTNDSSEKSAEESRNTETLQELEGEVTYLRERVTTYETEIERLRNEGLSQETDRRRFADAVNRFGEANRASDVGIREEVVSAHKVFQTNSNKI